MIVRRKPRPAAAGVTAPALQPCDVLSRLSAFPSWVEYRVGRLGAFLQEHGIRLQGLTTGAFDEIAAAIEQTGCRVFFNEVWQVPPPGVRRLALRFPKVTFISINHGSPVTGEAMAWWTRNHLGFAELSQALPNCWYGTVMPESRFPMPPGGKVVSLPNLVTLPDGWRAGPVDRPIDHTPVVGIFGRHVPTKNWMAQTAAIVEMAKVRPVTALLSSPAPQDQMADYLRWLDLAGVPWTYVPWQGWESYLRTLRFGVDVLLHASICESFGSIPAESALLGRPVVGTSAIEFLPDHWRANPQDPGDIARVALDHLDHYADRSAEGVDVATRAAGANATALLTNLSRFL
jgi:hypothetical protein